MQKQKPFSFIDLKKKNSISCAPDRTMLSTLLADADIPPMPGAGKYHWKISFTSDSAQFYFDQGINMYYGFHIIEAMASFKKAARLDPQNAMVWWAQALALGPNINDVGYAASPEALETIGKAIRLSTNAPALEKRLIKAMSLRYSEDSTQTREKLNQDYADEMKEIYKQFPSNADAAVLYADALMLQHPWNLWNADGTPKPWTPQATGKNTRSSRRQPLLYSCDGSIALCSKSPAQCRSFGQDNAWLITHGAYAFSYLFAGRTV
jgi:hypothetical protein